MQRVNWSEARAEPQVRSTSASTDNDFFLRRERPLVPEDVVPGTATQKFTYSLELSVVKIKARKHVCKIVPSSLLLFLSASVALAQSTSPGNNGGMGLNVGVGDKYNRVNLNYETAPFYSYRFGGNWGRLDITGEFGVAYWRAHSGGHRASVWQFIATPMLRWWITDRFYVEGGVGPSIFTHTQFADKNISTAFQFADQIGLGYQLTKNSRLGLRYSHFSNANIKTPNPGLDVTQISYTYQF